MSVDRRVGTKVDKNLRREEALATRVDPYPYIGIVKNNLDPTRSGRLQVFIPDLGGDEQDKKTWRTVRYASPFMGYTNTQEQSQKNSFTTVQHSYGMWMVPPDIGVQVICLFIAGDPQRGYWLACVNPYLSHHMVPGLAGSENVDTQHTSAEAKKGLVAGTRVPVAEFNLAQDVLVNPTFYNNLKPVHEFQFNRLKVQGLERDPVRGAITSSSQRESPSCVFGISTPGRPLEDPADNPSQFKSDANSGKFTKEDLVIKSRKGGHTFVMDDGATLGADQLIRLRTAKGHQILMHDTANSLYISHAEGTSWIEMTSTGSVNIYTKESFNVHCEGSLNLRSGNNINIEATNNVNIRSVKAKTSINTGSSFEVLSSSSFNIQSKGTGRMKSGGLFAVQAGGRISMRASSIIAMRARRVNLNSGGTVAVPGIRPIKTNNLPNTEFDKGTGTWKIQPAKLSTIVTVAPTHEPYQRKDQVELFVVKSNGIQPQEKFAGDKDATKSAAGTAVANPVTEQDIRNQPETTQTIGPLNKEQMQAVYAQIGKTASGGNYAAESATGLGKYDLSLDSLKQAGFVKPNVTSLEQLSNPNTWTGKDGIDGKTTLLNNTIVQEEAMQSLTQRNFNAMMKNGAITADMGPEEVAGMLIGGHKLSADGIKQWRQEALGSAEAALSGSSLFQQGKYAVSVLGPKVSQINAG